MNLGWLGVPPLGGLNVLGRLKPGLQTSDVPRTGSWSQCMRKNERGLSMNRRVLTASCRQNNRRKALPARCWQHLGGAVSPLGGSWSQRTEQNREGFPKTYLSSNDNLELAAQELRLDSTMMACKFPTMIRTQSVVRTRPSFDSARSWLSPGRFALLLAAFIFAGYPDVVLGRGTFIFRDFGGFAYPLAFHHRESFWRGEIPL